MHVLGQAMAINGNVYADAQLGESGLGSNKRKGCRVGGERTEESLLCRKLLSIMLHAAPVFMDRC